MSAVLLRRLGLFLRFAPFPVEVQLVWTSPIGLLRVSFREGNYATRLVVSASISYAEGDTRVTTTSHMDTSPDSRPLEVV